MFCIWEGPEPLGARGQTVVDVILRMFPQDSPLLVFNQVTPGTALEGHCR